MQHHDQELSPQSRFVKHVESLVEMFDELGNMFGKDSEDLIVLDTKEIIAESASVCLQSIKSKGKFQYDRYVEEHCVTPVSGIIPRNNMTVYDMSRTGKNFTLN